MPLIISHQNFNPAIRKIEDDIYLQDCSYFSLGDNYCNMWDFTTILSKGIKNRTLRINY